MSQVVRQSKGSAELIYSQFKQRRLHDEITFARENHLYRQYIIDIEGELDSYSEYQNEKWSSRLELSLVHNRMLHPSVADRCGGWGGGGLKLYVYISDTI
jgi:hypothetical protein